MTPPSSDTPAPSTAQTNPRPVSTPPLAHRKRHRSPVKVESDYVEQGTLCSKTGIASRKRLRTMAKDVLDDCVAHPGTILGQSSSGSSVSLSVVSDSDSSASLSTSAIPSNSTSSISVSSSLSSLVVEKIQEVRPDQEEDQEDEDPEDKRVEAAYNHIVRMVEELREWTNQQGF